MSDDAKAVEYEAEAREEFGQWELMGVTTEQGYHNACMGDPLAEGDRVKVIESAYADWLEEKRDSLKRTAHYLAESRDEALARAVTAEHQLREAREQRDELQRRLVRVIDNKEDRFELVCQERDDGEVHIQRLETDLERCQEALRRIANFEEAEHVADAAIYCRDVARSVLSQQSVPNTPETE